ncbi:MAG: SUMF1/EgtB/PvdO family nonheme iron enzyme, partial [Elainellaceae cyanobacterium]
QGSFTHSLLQAMRIQGEGNCATVERLYQYLRYRVPLMNRQHSKPTQTPYAVVEPATKYHLILLPRLATVRDSEILKLDAFKAENAREFSLAEQLWIRVLMVSPGDPDAIEGIRRVDRLRSGAQGSASSDKTDNSGDRRIGLVQPPVPPPKPESSSDRRPASMPQRPEPPKAPQPQPIFSSTPASQQSSSAPRRKSSARSVATPSAGTPRSQPLSFPISRRRLLQISGGVGAGVGAIALGRLFQGGSESSQSIHPETKSDTTVEFSVVTVTDTGEVANVERKSAAYRTEDLGDGIGLEMMSIPAGTFTMGSPPQEEDHKASERPQHRVSVPAFEIGKYQITQAQWRAIASLPKVNQYLEANPSNFRGDNRPVEKVSWDDAVEFCERLSQQTGRDYQLPSEAQWEYACRAGTTTPFHFGKTITPDLANYNGNYTYRSGVEGIYRGETTDVGSFLPNAFGLCDMHGNLWEWCLDHWHDNYQGAPLDGSAWIERPNLFRVRRGGSWNVSPGLCRSASRNKSGEHDDLFYVGFRVVCLTPTT